MDKLEKFIITNREEFDIYEPSEELWDRIEKRKKTKTFLAISWKKTLSIAASICFIVMTTIYVQSFIKQEKYNAQIKEQHDIIDEELAKIEDYYNQQLDYKMTQISSLTSNNPEIRNNINTDLAELDSIYADLKNDLNDNIRNAEVINAMIENYKMKLQILEDILYFLQKNKHQNDDNDKKYDI